MNTLMIVASLFSLQPSAAQVEVESFDLQSMREQVRAYIVEDVANVSHVIYGVLREGITLGSSLVDQESDAATLTAQQDKAADTAEQSQYRVN